MFYIDNIIAAICVYLIINKHFMSFGSFVFL